MSSDEQALTHAAKGRTQLCAHTPQKKKAGGSLNPQSLPLGAAGEALSPPPPTTTPKPVGRSRGLRRRRPHPLLTPSPRPPAPLLPVPHEAPAVRVAGSDGAPQAPPAIFSPSVAGERAVLGRAEAREGAKRAQPGPTGGGGAAVGRKESRDDEAEPAPPAGRRGGLGAAGGLARQDARGSGTAPLRLHSPPVQVGRAWCVRLKASSPVSQVE